jgi:hypothetical protein
MARGNGSTTGLRASAARLRKEGERLAARIDRDVRALTKRTRLEITTDVRKLEHALRLRATDAIRDIEKRSARVVGGVEKQVVKAGADVLKRLHGATQADVAALARRVKALEDRLAALEGLKEGEEPLV